MKKLKEICTVFGLSTSFILLTGCHGLKLSFKTSSPQVAVSTEEANTNFTVSSKRVFNDSTINKQANTAATQLDDSIKDSNGEKAAKDDTSEELSVDDTTEIKKETGSVDVFEELYTFSLPAGYVLLDDQYNTDTSKMYALAKRGKIVATIFMNYPDTQSYKETEIRTAYQEEVNQKYDILLNSKMEINNFCWDGYYGNLKNEEGKTGYVLLDSNEGKTVYLEFMCISSYDCALDVAEVLKSFKLNKKEKEKDE